jgi:hypothetical protein
MKQVFNEMNEMKKKGLIVDYAVGGGMGMVYYLEPILTIDIDIMFIPIDEKKFDIISPIIKHLKSKGYEMSEDHFIIERLPVQLLPTYNDLVREAVENANEITFKNIPAKVIKPEYLIAIATQTFRDKDKERIRKFASESILNKKLLLSILKKYNLVDKYKGITK